MKITDDVVQGGLFLAVGLAALGIGLDYPIGTPGRMGPGFFPLVIAVLLSLTGAALLLRARHGTSGIVRIERWSSLAIVPAAVALFGLLLEPLGLPLAVLMLCVGAATASVRFAWSWRAAAGAVLFAVVCGLLFVTLLGLPIPLVGSWLQAAGLP